MFASIAMPEKSSDWYRYFIIIFCGLGVLFLIPLNILPDAIYTLDENELILSSNYHIFKDRIQLFMITDVLEVRLIPDENHSYVPPIAEKKWRRNRALGTGKKEDWIMLKIDGWKKADYAWISPIRKRFFIEELLERNNSISLNNSALIEMEYQ